MWTEEKKSCSPGSSSYDGTLQSHTTIRTHTAAACAHIVSGTTIQHFLAVLLLRRTLLAAKMHPILLSFIKTQQRSSDAIEDCLWLLWIIIGLPPELQQSLPKECLPPLPRRSP
ncbi:hypothetical protein DUNSADRAFT_13020 [Dunaliella salina]|uniref:Encoded protein n=1 Tax=Dunaliella salina TaxID=3046 RepID=A0ABQ7GA79_DUNSA|nr:hypothetical protein DUNSADRAFT_13020 [Dunaliella salina]|eukprot:KAF5831516.1 hypothetical protein DUNSADRAFT_13020 [Dunaliella salina]